MEKLNSNLVEKKSFPERLRTNMLFSSLSKSVLQLGIIVGLMSIFNTTVLGQSENENRKEKKSKENATSKVEEEVNFWMKEPFGKMEISKEAVEKRDAFSKHFHNELGGFTAHIASGPIHYQESGQWKTIYHTIEPSLNGGFQNIHNSFKTYYPALASGSIETVLPNGQVMRDMQDMRMYYEADGQEMGVMNISGTNGQADFNVLSYSGIYGAEIDLRLTQHTTMRKMDYILKNSNALNFAPQGAQYLVFEEKVLLPEGLVAILENNTIYLLSFDGKVIAQYEKPLIKENHSEKGKEKKSGRSEAIYTISQTGNELTIQTKVLMSWLKSSDRIFPIEVDPTVNLYPNATANWTGCFETRSTSTANSYTSTNIGGSFNTNDMLSCDAIGAGAVPGHADEETAVMTPVRRPPGLGIRHQGVDVALKRRQVELLELLGVVEGLAHGVGQGGVLVKNVEIELVRPPVLVGPAGMGRVRGRPMHHRALAQAGRFAVIHCYSLHSTCCVEFGPEQPCRLLLLFQCVDHEALVACVDQSRIPLQCNGDMSLAVAPCGYATKI